MSGVRAVLSIIAMVALLARADPRDTRGYLKRCDFAYIELVEEFPSEMSSIERNYIVHLHNDFRNEIALGHVTGFPACTNMGYVQYDLALEYILTCFLRSGLLDVGDIHSQQQQTRVDQLRDLEDNVVALSHYLRSYFRPFEMRKTLLKTGFLAWCNVTHRRKTALQHIAFHGMRAIGCSKLITARLFPMYGYEFGCLYKSETTLPDQAGMATIANGNKAGRPHFNYNQKYPALTRYKYVVKPFTPPLKGVIGDAACTVHSSSAPLCGLLIVLSAVFW